MEYKVLLRILKEKDNCFINEDTYKKVNQEQIEKDCGFKVRIRPTNNLVVNGYVVEKVKENK